MRRSIIIVCLVCLNLALYAQDGYLNINQIDKSYSAPVLSVDSMWIAPNKTNVLFGIDGTCTAQFAAGKVESVTLGAKTANASGFTTRHEIIQAISDYAISDYTESKEPGYDEDLDDAADYYNDFGTKNALNLTVTFNGNSATATINSSDVTISKNGAHVTIVTKKKLKITLKGSTDNGSLTILTPDGNSDNKKLWVVLNGVSITNPNGPAINIQSSKSVYVQLAKNTTSTLQDGQTYTVQTGVDQKGTLFSEGQLLFHGSGSLTVNSLGGHGICSDDYIRFRADLGTINITSVKDGINTKDKFIMYGGNIDISSSSDGIVVRRGKLSLFGGKINMNCVDDGLVSDYTSSDTAGIVFAGGYTKISTTGPKGHAVSTTGAFTMTGGALEANVSGQASKCISAKTDITIQDGKLKLTAQGTSIYDQEEQEYSSAAGIRAQGNLNIKGGQIMILSTGAGSKGINTNGTTSITGGTLYIDNQGTIFTDTNQNTVNARALDTIKLILEGNPAIYLNAATTSIHINTDLIMAGGEIYSYSGTEQSKSLNVKGNVIQTGGLLLYGK